MQKLELELEYVDPQAKQSVAEPITEPIPMRLIKLPAGFGCDEFYLSETPVTEAQWCAVMGGGLANPANPDYPKVAVTYTDVQEFCRKASDCYSVTFRLPTEFEWCRAVGVEPVPERLKDYAVFNKNAICAVKTKLPNEFGLYDMRGLVWEWLQEMCGEHRLRGGSWFLHSFYCRSAGRSTYGPGDHGNDVGFRVVVGVF
jgi:formylglycine-generating enzyme required for sulfatase activity